MQQRTLFKLKDYGSEFGGSSLQNKRKSRRPLSLKNPLKIVLKIDSLKSKNLTCFRGSIEGLFNKFSKQFNVRVYEVAVCGDHIHFVGLFVAKNSYAKFIRALTGTIARLLNVKFKFRPWSRILHWGRALRIAINYTLQNHLEATGAIAYQPRPKDLARTRWLLQRGTNKLDNTKNCLKT